MLVGNTTHRPLIHSSIPTDELYHWMMKRFPTAENGEFAQCIYWFFFSAAKALQLRLLILMPLVKVCCNRQTVIP